MAQSDTQGPGILVAVLHHKSWFGSSHLGRSMALGCEPADQLAPMGGVHWMSPDCMRPSREDGNDGVSYQGEVLQHIGAY